MALIKCEECGKAISDSARACPNCGFPRTYSIMTYVTILAFVGGAAFFWNSKNAEQEREQTAGQSSLKSTPEADKKRSGSASVQRLDPKQAPPKAKTIDPIQRAASGAKILKQSIQKPEDAKLESALVVEGGGAICYQYLSRNSVDGMDSERAVLTPNGKLLLSATNGFSEAWGKECQDRKGIQAVAKINWQSL